MTLSIDTPTFPVPSRRLQPSTYVGYRDHISSACQAKKNSFLP